MQSALQISQRRESANTFLLTVNTLLFAALSGASVAGLGLLQPAWTLLISLCGVVLCFWWWRLIQAYKDLNSGKFNVIHRLEKELPAKPFTDEWNCLGKGKDSKKYRPVTEIETKIPWVFAILYLVLIVWSFVKSITCG